MSSLPNLTVNGNTYAFRKLNPITAMTLVLKIAPLMKGMTGLDARSLLGAATPATGGDEATEKARKDATMQQAIGSLLNGLGELTEQSVREVSSICLNVVQRQLPGGTGWAPVWTGGADGQLMYEDIDLPEMLQLMARVMMDNLLSFTRALPQPA